MIYELTINFGNRDMQENIYISDFINLTNQLIHTLTYAALNNEKVQCNITNHNVSEFSDIDIKERYTEKKENTNE